ncbi:PKD domain-containing protein [Pseudoruegeria sp. HB172150]|uniref:PKD domain-containing protein n=1 Tax=Pseudoruegeria sp. HB172150 TaxID=2721164 RepID=UPI00155598ED|nr:PKD domain-containing protein [Pseudoruegeria sp. HB172150]
MAGGAYWANSTYNYSGYSDISSAEIEAACGLTSVTILSQNGADAASLAAEDYLGIKFSGSLDGGTTFHEWEVAVSGVTGTTLINTTDYVPNAAPTADAGPDQTVASAANVSLDGSGSSDGDSDPLTYAWTQTSGTTVTLDDSTSASPSFTAPTLATNGSDEDLVFQLIVNDGTVDSAADTVTISVEAPTNVAPTADAGPNQTVDSGEAVTLDGTGSSDPESDPLTYAWTQTSGTTVTLDDSTAASPGFTAPTLPINGSDEDLVFQLIVNDGFTDSAADTVTISVEAPTNAAPTADAGPDQTVASAATVSLDGSGSSDGDSDPLTYAWTQTSGTTVTLDDPSAASPGFTAPTLATNGSDEDLVFQLIVNDGTVDSAADTVTITVEAPVSLAPTADAGPNQTVASEATVTLDGTGSTDPESDPLTYAWTQTSGTAVTLDDPASATPGFTAPALPTNGSDEDLVFQLIVNDGFTDSAADTVTISVGAPVSAAPTADAGPNQTVDAGASVSLDGTGSTDPEDDPLTYAWTQTSGTAVTLDDPSAATPVFTAPELDFNADDITLVFQLIVNDGFTDSSADTVTITVAAPTDVTKPEVVILDAPEQIVDGSPFQVTVRFSEDVTGFEASDLTLTGASATGLAGSGAEYEVTIDPVGGQDVTIAVPAGVAIDAAGNSNTASATVAIIYVPVEETEKFIAESMAARGRALISTQPKLGRLLSGNGGGFVDAGVSQGRQFFDLETSTDALIWLQATGYWSTSGDLDAGYYNAILGANLYRGEDIRLGVMLQGDRFAADDGQFEFDGNGWLVGPYAVYRLPTHPLIFSASYLEGRAQNTVSGLAGGDFESRRSLLTLGVEGEVALDGITLMPRLDYARATDRHDGYTATAGVPVSGESVTIQEALLGVDFEMPLTGFGPNLMLTGGVGGIFSREETSLGTDESSRARLALGLEQVTLNGSVIHVSTFAEGLGGGLDAYGAELSWQLKF